MRKWNILFAMVLVLLAVGMTISAQDDGTTDDNWCLEGGPWEDDCGTDARGEWMWTCGWYYAQAQLGNVHWLPWWCATQMPAGCYIATDYIDAWVYSGVPNEIGNVSLVSPDCGSAWSLGPAPWGLVFANDLAQAAEICADAGGSFVESTELPPWWDTFDDDAFWCYP